MPFLIFLVVMSVASVKMPISKLEISWILSNLFLFSSVNITPEFRRYFSNTVGSDGMANNDDVYPMPLQLAMSQEQTFSRILCNRKLRSKQQVTSVMSYTPICACMLRWDPRAPVHHALVVVVISCRIITASSFARLFWGTKGHKIKSSILTLKHSG